MRFNRFGNRYFDKDDPGAVTTPEEVKQPVVIEEEVKPPVIPDNIEEIDKQIEALELKITNESEPTTPPVKDTEKVDTPEFDLLNSSKEVQKPEETPQTETPKPPEPPTPDTEKDTAKGLILTEEMLKEMNLAPDEDRYARKFINKPVTELAKAYANSQKFIGKKKEDLLKTLEPAGNITPQAINTPSNIPVPPKPQTQDEVAQAKDDLLFNTLVKDFPDLPQDPAERKAWLTTLNYEDREKADEYIEKKKTFSKEIDQVWQQREVLVAKKSEIIDQQLGGALEAIKSFFVNEVGKTPEEMGYNLQLDEKGENPIINELLTDPNNPDDFDPSVITKYYDVELPNKMALVNKFIMKERKAIIDKIKAEARAEGANSVKQKPVAPSMGTTLPGKGEIKKEVTMDKVATVGGVEEIDKLLDTIEHKFQN